MPFQNDILAGASGAGGAEYSLWGWGSNAKGQIGYDLANDSPYGAVNHSVPVEIMGDPADLPSGVNLLGSGYDDDTFGLDKNKVSAATTGEGKVSCSGTTSNQHTAFIKGDGTLWVMGGNNEGQLGLGDVIARCSPVQIGTESTWTSVSCGQEQTGAIREGKLFTTGGNVGGVLGDGTTISRSSPVQIGTLTNWKQICVSAYTNNKGCLAIKTDNTLWAWGRNSEGGLGLGNTTHICSPQQVGTLTNWLQVTTGLSAATHAVKTDGTLWAWGNNSQGSLGTNNNTQYSSPVQIGTDTSWTHVSQGYYGCGHVIKTDGTLWWWGRGVGSPQGSGTTRSSPVQIGTLTSWSTVSAGMVGGHGILTDGTLWGWGYNAATDSTKGSIGDTTTINRNSPVQVGTDTDWLDLAKPSYGGVDQSKQFVLAIKEVS